MSAVWWSVESATGYLGEAPRDGLEWTRHGYLNHPGLWRVAITGWGDACGHPAVMDDFGNLVQVQAPAPQLGSMS
jgi:hypothetical protein